MLPLAKSKSKIAWKLFPTPLFNNLFRRDSNGEAVLAIASVNLATPQPTKGIQTNLSDPGGSRTHNQQNRNLSFYPVELRDQCN